MNWLFFAFDSDSKSSIGRGSVVDEKAVAGLTRKTTKGLLRRSKKVNKTKKQKKRAAIKSAPAKPVEDNRLKGLADGLKIEPTAEELRASPNSKTRGEMEREIVRSGERSRAIRRRRF